MQRSVILLSDVRLQHVLTRELLNELRHPVEGNAFPLYTVEYDNPKPYQSTPRRWNAVTNLEILLRSVTYCCFGPEDVVLRINAPARLPGNLNREETNSYFRGQMRLQDVLDESIEDGPRTIARGKIGVELFPMYNRESRDLLLHRFLEVWGKGLLRLLSEIAPYRAHINAAQAVSEGWAPSGDAIGALAREALFEGVGMFWTLEQGDKHWRERVKQAGALKATPPAQTDISKAWRLVDETKWAEFNRERSRLYLRKVDEQSAEKCRAFYEVAITYAAQVGLALTWALLRHDNPSADREKVLNALIAGINRSLETGPVQSRDRKLILSKQEPEAFNQLPKLDAPDAAYFRVFWWELMLFSAANQEELEKAGVDMDAAKATLKRGRKFYLEKIIADRKEDIQRTHRDWSDPKCLQEAQQSAISALARAYHWWFGWGTDDARVMLQELIEKPASDAESILEDSPISEYEPPADDSTI